MQPIPADSPGDGRRQRLKKRPAWQILLAAVAAILLCFITAYAIGYWRQASALNAEIAAIRERGEPVRFAELAPLPGAENLTRGDRLSATLKTLKPLDDEFSAQFGSDELPDVADLSPFLPVLNENRVPRGRNH